MAKVYNTLAEVLVRYSTGWVACVRPDGNLSRVREFTWHWTKEAAKARLRRGMVLDERIIKITPELRRVLLRRKVKS